MCRVLRYMITFTYFTIHTCLSVTDSKEDQIYVLYHFNVRNLEHVNKTEFRFLQNTNFSHL